MLFGLRRWRPLTLTLSPPAGRGDVPNAASRVKEAGAAYPLLPASGGPKDGSRHVARPRQRCRQADEGQAAIS
ncbi:hypothetical protein GFM29_34045 [Rhizobium leguminosarum bv. viciae]|nr:hypothetical protein [Rhizobium leguminosarum bv. viciae]